MLVEASVSSDDVENTPRIKDGVVPQARNSPDKVGDDCGGLNAKAHGQGLQSEGVFGMLGR
jgi:hypothetical protein